MKNFLKENWFKLFLVFLVALLVGNYFYTFSGFVAYTEGERRACTLLENIFSLETFDQRKEKYENTFQENKVLMNKYATSFLEKEKRCKSIQQFYVEEGIIILVGIIAFTKKMKNENLS